MDRDQYTDASYTAPHVPPATAPVIDAQASPRDAAELAADDGDSDYPGSRVASGGQDEPDTAPDPGPDVAPGKGPDEIVPDDGDVIEPPQPDEIEGDPGEDIDQPDGGDIDEPFRTPDEIAPPPD